jgi:hypothetical protein
MNRHTAAYASPLSACMHVLPGTATAKLLLHVMLPKCRQEPYTPYTP